MLRELKERMARRRAERRATKPERCSERLAPRRSAGSISGPSTTTASSGGQGARSSPEAKGTSVSVGSVRRSAAEQDVVGARAPVAEAVARL
jgi:hypothetical protein